jgi:hypothetical protein
MIGMPGQPIGNLQANSYVNRRTEDEITDVLNRAGAKAETIAEDKDSALYAAGVEAALTWAFGMSGDHPLDG